MSKKYGVTVDFSLGINRPMKQDEYVIFKGIHCTAYDTKDTFVFAGAEKTKSIDIDFPVISLAPSFSDPKKLNFLGLDASIYKRKRHPQTMRNFQWDNLSEAIVEVEIRTKDGLAIETIGNFTVCNDKGTKFYRFDKPDLIIGGKDNNGNKKN